MGDNKNEKSRPLTIINFLALIIILSTSINYLPSNYIFKPPDSTLIIYNLEEDKFENIIHHFDNTEITGVTTFVLANETYYGFIYLVDRNRIIDLRFQYAPIEDPDNLTENSISGLGTVDEFQYLRDLNVYEYIDNQPIFVSLLNSKNGSNVFFKFNILGVKVESQEILASTSNYFNPTYVNYMGNNSYRMQVGYFMNEGKQSVTRRSLVSIDDKGREFDFLELTSEFSSFFMLNKSDTKSNFLIIKGNSDNNNNSLYELDYQGNEITQYSLTYKIVNNIGYSFSIGAVIDTNHVIIERIGNNYLQSYFTITNYLLLFVVMSLVVLVVILYRRKKLKHSRTNYSK